MCLNENGKWFGLWMKESGPETIRRKLCKFRPARASLPVERIGRIRWIRRAAVRSFQSNERSEKKVRANAFRLDVKVTSRVDSKARV